MNEANKLPIAELEGLLEKFTERLTGEATPERIELVKLWCLFGHMQRVMPPLVQHWASVAEHQEAKAKLREINEQIKQWNQELHKKE
ncbi:DUF2573 family protein [Brevibacillus fulvus]|uniref:DUF2573 domain-containing protein n=1 Tax=Brevibacillus fulvus TaxID=1125967 RepID=A0A939BTG3_9BACL|nr:DUF2573 family protein [Brevibacillus fulvus]MBM7589444.1 hypothetical protein [Brevibacillus fulvus]